MQKKGLESIFVIIAIVAGVFILYLTPPFASPDEEVHFLNTYGYAYNIPKELNEDGSVFGRYYPKDVADFFNDNMWNYFGNLHAKYSFYDNHMDSWNRDITGGEDQFLSNAAININIIGYLLPTMGMFLTRLLVPFNVFQVPYNLLLAGRFANLIGYVIITYCAIKTTPIYKKTLFFLALTPINIFLASSITYDALLISSGFLLFAYILKLYDKGEKAKIRDYIVIGLIAIVFASAKQVYLPLILITFILPVTFFGDVKKYIFSALLIISVVLIVYFSPRIFMSDYYLVQNNEMAQKQLEFIASDPLNFINIIRNTIGELAFSYMREFFGTLGQVDTQLPYPFFIAYYYILLAVVLMDSVTAKLVIPIKARVLALMGSTISVILILIAMYTWTPNIEEYFGEIILGVQGRYFMPIAMFLCLLITNCCPKRVFNKIKQITILNTAYASTDQFITVSSTIILSVSCLSLLLRYRSL